AAAAAASVAVAAAWAVAVAWAVDLEDLTMMMILLPVVDLTMMMMILLPVVDLPMMMTPMMTPPVVRLAWCY
ncbi:MAG: hypothetical protein AAFZ92_11415, partial [Pseudomonadota bacterium]